MTPCPHWRLETSATGSKTSTTDGGAGRDGRCRTGAPLDGLNRATIVMLCAHFEGYLEEMLSGTSAGSRQQTRQQCAHRSPPPVCAEERRQSVRLPWHEQAEPRHQLAQGGQ